MHVSNVMTADVVIIGGGVMGTATAFQMAKAGLDVILCEMRTLGSGASGRCGGMVVHCYGREANIDKTDQRLLFTRENTRMLKEFQQELDIDYEFRQIGCVDIATTEEEWQLMQDLIKTQRSLGDDENQLLDKQQLQELIEASLANSREIVQMVEDIVPTYHPSGKKDIEKKENVHMRSG